MYPTDYIDYMDYPIELMHRMYSPHHKDRWAHTLRLPHIRHVPELYKRQVTMK